MRLWKTRIKREDIERNQTAGGWWEAPAAVPTSFFSFFSIRLSPLFLSLPIFILLLPSLCISVTIKTLGFVASMCVSVCERVGMRGMVISVLMRVLPVGLASCPFVPAQTRCTVSKTQGARLKKNSRVSHNKHTGRIFYWHLNSLCHSCRRMSICILISSVTFSRMSPDVWVRRAVVELLYILCSIISFIFQMAVLLHMSAFYCHKCQKFRLKKIFVQQTPPIC